MKFKKLTNWDNRPLILDADRVISVGETAPRTKYSIPNDYKSPLINLPACTVMLDGESASNDSGQGFIVLGKLDEVLQQLGLTLS